MTEMTTEEFALVEEIAALGKIYTECRTADDQIRRTRMLDECDLNAISALNCAGQYAAEQILRKIRNYAADINNGADKDDDV